MKRRDFLKLSAFSSMAASLPTSFSVQAQSQLNYDGPLYLTLSAEGGWDVTSFCDPKLNVPGEEVINHWAQTGDIGQAGNLRYAEFANNRQFFDKYYSDMMVINGVDAQTNSHTAGIVHNWSGRISEGYPSIQSLVSNAFAPDLPLSYVSNGGYAETARLTRYSRIDDPSQLKSIINTNQARWGEENSLFHDDDWQRLQRYQQERIARLGSQGNLMPRQQYNRDAFLSGMSGSGDLRALADILPAYDQLQQDQQIGDFSSSLMRQIQMVLLAFQSGTAMSGDLLLSGFDTHSNHDADQEPLLAHLTDGIDYLWTYAEQLGLADRIRLVIGSDFGRTPSYNSDGGKDHWPIGSFIFMQKNAPWGNRVVGATDEGHNALKINPGSLQQDNSGTLIYPSHVHHAMRNYFGLANDADTSRFPLTNTSTLDLFNQNLMTVQSTSDPRNITRLV